MDARTGLVVGGMTAVAASVAVVCAVAMTNTAALKDSPATTVASSRILVPASSSTPSATPTPTLTQAPAVPDEAEVVEAPAPTEVEPPASTADNPPRTPPPAAQPQAGAPAGDVESAIEAARVAGTWDSLRAWAAANGWSDGRIDSLIKRLERAAEADRLSGGAQLQAPDKSAPAQKDSAAVVGGSTDRLVQAPAAPTNQGGSQKQSHPQHPANAGSPGNGNGNGAGPDAKKDQPRNSPDKRG